MPARFLVAGTLVGGVVLTVLGFLTAAVLPPRYSQFTDARAVVETIRANSAANGIYTAPQGVFVAVALRPDGSNRLQSPGAHLAGQVAIEFAVALGLSALLHATSIRSPLRAAGVLGFIGLVAGTQMRFPEWNWRGFPWSTCWQELVTWRRTGLSRGSCWASCARTWPRWGPASAFA